MSGEKERTAGATELVDRLWAHADREVRERVGPDPRPALVAATLGVYAALRVDGMGADEAMTAAAERVAQEARR